MPETSYEIDRNPLRVLLREAGDGHVQLPDFQRGWVWDDDRIRSLLASISLSYPVGAVMMMEAGGETQFTPRLIEGAPTSTRKADRLILDGQQRLTSLFQSLLLDEPVATQDQRKRKIKRWYYIDMRKAIHEEAADREDAILSIPEDKKVRTFRNEITVDYSTAELEYQNMVFPFASIFDSKPWRRGYSNFWGDKGELDERMDIWDQFESQVIEKFEQYLLPVVKLGKDTPKEAVCQVFEKVNTSGVTLTVFDLLTAMFAADGFRLGPDWDAREKQLKRHSVLQNVSNTDFLAAITLLATRERREQDLKTTPDMERPPAISCKRADMLKLTRAEYQSWSDPLMKGFERAAFFLHSKHISIFDAKFLPYGSQLIPLAAILTVLDRDNLSESEQEKLAQWYWCGVFGELYGGTTETRFARDLPEVVEWMRGGADVPRTVGDAVFAASRLLSLQSRRSAAYKGVYSLILREGARDLMTGNSTSVHHYFEWKVDVHHIFPQKWCKDRKIDQNLCNSIVNKTPLSTPTNIRIGGAAPSEYTTRIERSAGITSEKLNNHLRSHFIDPEILRNDDFDGFFEARREALLERIEQAMGKDAVRDIDDEGEEPSADDYEVIDEESQTIVDDDE